MSLEELLISYGYSSDDIEIIVNSNPSIKYKDASFKKKVIDIINYMNNNLGYKKEEIIKMTSGLPTIFSLSIDNINKKIEDMMLLGYTKEEVMKMTKKLPMIYGYSIENMNKKIEEIMLLNYSREEVIKMTKALPAIFGYSIENINQKIDFYDSIEMHNLAIVNTKNLMQSVNLSYARYMFFKDKQIKVSMDNYIILFVRNKQFEDQYGITKEELIEKYDYEKYKEKENGRTN